MKEWTADTDPAHADPLNTVSYHRGGSDPTKLRAAFLFCPPLDP